MSALQRGTSGNTFGEQLRIERESRKLTQADVAKLLGYTTAQFVSNCERGIAYLPKKDLLKVCKLWRTPYKKLAVLAAKEESEKVYKSWLNTKDAHKPRTKKRSH